MLRSFTIYRLLLLIGVVIIGAAIVNLITRRTEYIKRRLAVSTSLSNKSKVMNKYEHCDKGFHPNVESMSNTGYSIPASSYNSLDKFTILTMVFNRFQSFREVIKHYICMPSVDRMVLLWANQEVEPPTKESLKVDCNERLFIHRLGSDALTGRFANFPEIQTDAVFNVDDDKLYHASDLRHAFEVWKKYPWGLVGPEPRGCTGTFPNLTYEADLVSSSYNMILTSAAFLHHEYLRMFEDKCTGKVRADIDQNRNCEDILMNFIVKDYCKCSGVFYVGRGHLRNPKNIPHSTKLSSRRSHHRHRTVCLRNYLTLYSNSFNWSSSSCKY